MTKYSELWDKIKNLIEKINDKPEYGKEYGKDFIKTKFISDDTLPLGKILSVHNTKIILKSVFQEDNKYYP